MPGTLDISQQSAETIIKNNCFWEKNKYDDDDGRWGRGEDTCSDNRL